MQESDIEVTFGPIVGDRKTLSKAVLATLNGIYRHLIAHNLEWSDVVALFEKLGSVEQRSHNIHRPASELAARYKYIKKVISEFRY